MPCLGILRHAMLVPPSKGGSGKWMVVKCSTANHGRQRTKRDFRELVQQFLLNGNRTKERQLSIKGSFSPEVASPNSPTQGSGSALE